MTVDFDKILKEIKTSWLQSKPNNLTQLRQLTSAVNQRPYHFSWINKKYKQKLTENCIKVTFNLESFVEPFIESKGIQCNNFILSKFYNKFWEQILSKNSSKIVSIHNFCFVSTEELKIEVEPFKIIKNERLQYIYPYTESKWVLIIDGQKIYKGLTKKSIEDVDKLIIDELRMINLKKFLEE
jgi:hypothetical protein